MNDAAQQTELAVLQCTASVNLLRSTEMNQSHFIFPVGFAPSPSGQVEVAVNLSFQISSNHEIPACLAHEYWAYWAGSSDDLGWSTTNFIQ